MLTVTTSSIKRESLLDRENKEKRGPHTQAIEHLGRPKKYIGHDDDDDQWRPFFLSFNWFFGPGRTRTRIRRRTTSLSLSLSCCYVSNRPSTKRMEWPRDLLTLFFNSQVHPSLFQVSEGQTKSNKKKKKKRGDWKYISILSFLGMLLDYIYRILDVVFLIVSLYLSRVLSTTTKNKY